MPKIVNKEQKREEICELAYSEFVLKGLEKFSLNEFIASISMSKGQFYHYFSNKDDLVVEVMSLKSEQLMEYGNKNYSYEQSFQEKLLNFFALFVDDTDKVYQDYNTFLRDIFHLYTKSDNPKIKEFSEHIHIALYKEMEEIFDEEIKKGVIKEEAKAFIRPMCATADGFYLQSMFLDSMDVRKDIYEYIILMEKFLKKI